MVGDDLAVNGDLTSFYKTFRLYPLEVGGIADIFIDAKGHLAFNSVAASFAK